MKLSKGLSFLAVEQELAEVEAAFGAKASKKAILARGAAIPVKLRRSFTMAGHRFWRVEAPGHPNHGSDLSELGLKDWGIIPTEWAGGH